MHAVSCYTDNAGQFSQHRRLQSAKESQKLQTKATLYTEACIQQEHSSS